ncbi:MAG: BON domain-containing protein [Gammaproteobacteria bacterium]
MMGRSAIIGTCCGFALLWMLSGCGPVIVGGVAGGAVVAHDTRTTGTFVEDEAIELKISNSVYRNPDLNSKSHINATSYNNIVLLTGEAATEDLRQRIHDLAADTEKVRQVHDYIRVGRISSLAARSNDTWITTQVKTQHLRIKGFDPTRVKVVTESAVVYLMGLLNRKEGAAVAELTRRIGGVRKVVKLFEYSDAP